MAGLWMPRYPIGEQDDPAGAVRLVGLEICGEMSPSDVPLAPWVDYESLRADDSDLLDVVVAVPEGRSKRKWYYQAGALKDIHAEIMASGLPGYMGHQRPENVDHEFPPLATQWIGAKLDQSAAKTVLYVRGLIDKSQENLKRWIRRRFIRQVSIYGRPKLARVGGEMHVVGYEPLSIDWTPLNRNGMPTRIVAMNGAPAGEFDAFLSGEPTGEQDDAQHNEGDGDVTLAEILRALRAELDARNTTLARVAGEMGWSFDTLVAEIGGEQYAGLSDRAAAYGEIAAALGLPADAGRTDLVTAARTARAAVEAQAQATQAELVARVVGEMVQAEAVRPVVADLVRVDAGADEAAVRAAVGEVVERPHVKQLLSSVAVAPVLRTATAGRGEQGANGLLVRRQVPV